MTLQSLPAELIERVFSLCSFEDLLNWQLTCRLFHDIITTSPLLIYILDLGLSGYTDEHVHPRCSLAIRQRMLADAQRVWKGAAAFELVQTLSFKHLSYWPVRHGILLRIADVERDSDYYDTNREDTVLDVSIITSTPGPPTLSWRVTLPVTESAILCVDPTQDLAVIRAPRSETNSRDAPLYFSCVPLSLRTGLTHLQAKQRMIRFRLSERVQTRPHYTRVQVYGPTLAVSIASGIHHFTEIVVFDWTSSEQLASFSSSTSDPYIWGDPAVLISPTCFLLANYSRTDQTPTIGVHAIDTNLPLRDVDGDNTRPTAHIASYRLPHTRAGEVRMLMTPSSPHQVWSVDESMGYLLTSPESIMLRVYIHSTLSQLRDAGFFVPLRFFLHELSLYFSLPIAERSTYETRVVESKQWMQHTRWINGEVGSWTSEVRRSQKGVGPWYAFPRYIVDFSPRELAKEVYKRRMTEPKISSFESEVEGYTTFCGTSELTHAGGAHLFASTFSFSLPYREKTLSHLPEFSPDSDLHLIGDKLVSVEGGIQDEVKIYQIIPESPSDEE